MAPVRSGHVNVVDIRRDELDESLLKLVLASINPEDGGAKTLPTLLLYNERGLKLFEDITHLDEYYLTNAEIEVLQNHADQIAKQIPKGSRLVELGSGNLRKVDILLKAFERAEKTVEYFALDLSLPELQRTFAELSTDDYHYVTFSALHGTYDDALAWLTNPENRLASTCVLSLGSSLGNFSREESAQFLSRFAAVLGPSDSLIIGLDACQDPERVFRAYNDSLGVTHQFYRNGLDHANELLGFEAFKQKEWSICGHYEEDKGRHEAFYQSLKNITFQGVSFKKGEKLKLEDAFKYSAAESDSLWHASGLVKKATFANKRDDYHIHLLSPSKIMYQTKPEQYATQPVPSLDDWEQLWVAWDTATRGMIPSEELMAKPIKLRNNLIFYLGHIPTFADIHVTRATNGQPTDPPYYVSIFERGIDPDVDNPESCHDHSEIPDSWPAIYDILGFQGRVRERIRSCTQDVLARPDRRLGRALWLAFEHEVMHLETFLYMLLQSERVLAPPGRSVPDFKSMAQRANREVVPNDWFRVPATELRLGLDDAENDLGPDRFFGWDNERPSRTVSVGQFEAQGRPITNGEYARFLEQSRFELLPASWSTSSPKNAAGFNNDAKKTNGYRNGITHLVLNSQAENVASHAFMQDKSVRTVYGLIPLEHAMHWPVMASYDELAAYAKWANGRIPTLEEARSIYKYVEEAKSQVDKVPSSLISAVNGHLSNDGVEETPPYHRGLDRFSQEKPGPDPKTLHIDLEGCNVGFKNWHPTVVSNKGGKLSGQSDLGGAWEWTSSPLEYYKGFKAMDLYPGYTADFFDGKHNIMLGGSWSTHPRIAGRKTFVNWYQRNYPYVWATARLVRDL